MSTVGGARIIKVTIDSRHFSFARQLAAQRLKRIRAANAEAKYKTEVRRLKRFIAALGGSVEKEVEVPCSLIK